MKINNIEVPIDGVAVTVAAYFLSPPETKLRNAAVIGGLHFFLHSYEVQMHVDEHEVSKRHSFGYMHLKNNHEYSAIIPRDINQNHFKHMATASNSVHNIIGVDKSNRLPYHPPGYRSHRFNAIRPRGSLVHDY